MNANDEVGEVEVEVEVEDSECVRLRELWSFDVVIGVLKKGWILNFGLEVLVVEVVVVIVLSGKGTDFVLFTIGVE